MKHTLSDKEEQAIRLVHHDFMGLTRKKAAQQMEISQQRLSSILQSAQIKAPQLFPILTQDQYKVARAIIDCGYDRQTIAFHSEWPLKKVDTIIAQLRKKGVSLTVPKTVRYEPHMDDKVMRRF